MTTDGEEVEKKIKIDGKKNLRPVKKWIGLVLVMTVILSLAFYLLSGEKTENDIKRREFVGAQVNNDRVWWQVLLDKLLSFGGKAVYEF